MWETYNSSIGCAPDAEAFFELDMLLGTPEGTLDLSVLVDSLLIV
jgi:hypothetical protein